MSQVEFEKSLPGGRGAPLPLGDRRSLKKLVEDLGERGAAARLGLDRHTLARALAGLGLYPPTIFLIRQRLIGTTGTVDDQPLSTPGANT